VACRFFKKFRALCDEKRFLYRRRSVHGLPGPVRCLRWIEAVSSGPALCGKAMGTVYRSRPVSVRAHHACLGLRTERRFIRALFWASAWSAVALAVIKEIEEKKLADRAKLLGDLFRKELWKLKEKYSLIGDVRGSGLMIGMEMVSDDGEARERRKLFRRRKSGPFCGRVSPEGPDVLTAAPDRMFIL